MMIPRFAVGLAGLLLTIAGCTVDPLRFDPGFLLLAAACAAGGLLPVRLPGLAPLPFSLPLVGSVAVMGDASGAMSLGFLSGLATALAPRDDAADPPGRLRSAWSAAGAIAIAAGIAAAGVSRMGLTLVTAAFPSLPALELAAPAAGILACAALLARLLARLGDGSRGTARGEKRWGILLRAAGAPAAAMGVGLLGVLAAGLRGGDHETTAMACLLGAAAGGLGVTAGTLPLHRRARRLERRARTGLSLVESIALAIEAKDRTSERHLRRMRIYAVGVGRRLGMTHDELEDLEHAAVLHDIGKLVVPESILSKPASLSPEEFQVVSSHARVGAEILETTALSPRVVSMVRHHHERYDGSGYPAGLVGMEIPLGARILAAADTFEALTAERPYRRGVSVLEAVSYLERHAGTLFDPRVVRVLVEQHAELEDQVRLEEERAAREGASPSGRATRGRGAGTQRIAPPVQVVLDRIASSHMEVYSLHEIHQVLGKTLDIEESFALMAAKIRHLIHYSACAVYVLDADREILVPRHVSGAGAARIAALTIPMGGKVSGWAALHGRTVSVAAGLDPGDPASGRSDLEEITDDAEVASLRSCVAAPLMVDDALVGVIALYDLVEADYSPHEERLLGMIGRQAGGAVRAGLLFERTQEHALTDSLTGLPNSRYMFITFDQEAARAREEGTPLTLLLMDIDKFHEINDDFGHHAGDRFLMGMAKAIRSQLRLCDTCIRYSGDEFVAILPRLAGEEAEMVVERVREAARDYCMEARPGRPVRMSLTIGHATLPDDGADFEALMAKASARLEESKARRRGEDPGGRRGRAPRDVNSLAASERRH